MTEQPTLHQMLDEMRALARELTDTTSVPFYDNETGKFTTHPVPPMLKQLDEAVGGTGETTYKGRSNGSPAPLDLGAMELLENIQNEATDLHLQALKNEPYGPTERIRAIVALAGRWTEPQQIAWVIAQLKRWKTGITNQLTPEKRLHVAAACPACGVKMVRTEVDGEWRQVAALSVEAVTEPGGAKTYRCVCLNRNCGHEWPAGHLQLLADVIDQNTEHTTVQLTSTVEGTTGRLADVELVDCTCPHDPQRHMGGRCDVLGADGERCDCTGHVEQPERDWGRAVYTDDTKDTYQPPPCPNCGAPGDVEWVSVRGLDDPEDTYLPGMHTCTAGCALRITHPNPAIQRELRLQLHRRHLGWRLSTPPVDDQEQTA